MLSQAGAEVEERQYFKQLPSADEVRRLAKLVGGVHNLVSTKGRRYEELGLAAKSLDEEEWVALLASDPKLWRRPVVTDGDRVVIGYDEAKLKDLVTT